MGPIQLAADAIDAVGTSSVRIKRKLVLALSMIVLIPVGLIGWLGVRVAIEDQETVRRNLSRLLNSRLEDIRRQVTRTIEAVELELLKGLDSHHESVEKLQQLEAKTDIVRQAFLVDTRGRLIHPNPTKPATQAERAFLRRTRSIWYQRAILDPAGDPSETSNFPPSTQGKKPTKVLSNPVNQQLDPLTANRNEPKVQSGLRGGSRDGRRPTAHRSATRSGAAAVTASSIWPRLAVSAGSTGIGPRGCTCSSGSDASGAGSSAPRSIVSC